MQRTKHIQSSLEKEKPGDLYFQVSDTTMCYKATVKKTAWYQSRGR